MRSFLPPHFIPLQPFINQFNIPYPASAPSHLTSSYAREKLQNSNTHILPLVHFAQTPIFAVLESLPDYRAQSYNSLSNHQREGCRSG